jgi:hypothetical protein
MECCGNTIKDLYGFSCPLKCSTYILQSVKLKKSCRRIIKYPPGFLRSINKTLQKAIILPVHPSPDAQSDKYQTCIQPQS